MSELLLKSESYQVIGACVEVYKEKGCGFLEHRAQVHNYLKAAGYRLGLLVNFGHHPKVEWERIVR